MMKYIIVQAGGKGSRMGYLTKNKPKALVPVGNLPLLFHLFRKYPNKRFIIIADYLREVLHEYLSAFAEVTYQIVDAKGTGTCAGISRAIDLIPEREPFMLVWSDLLLWEKLELPKGYGDEAEGERPQADYLGISQTFSCRWLYRDNEFKEERSAAHGVAGFFLFQEKARIRHVPESGELVRWMQKTGMVFEEFGMGGTKEFGILEEYLKLGQEKCRPFNRISVCQNHFIKEPADRQGMELAKRESAWYEKARQLKCPALPEIYSTNPLEMELIRGQNIYNVHLSHEEKSQVLRALVHELKRLHASAWVEADSFSMKEAYFNKTVDRLAKIRDLVPFGREREIVINGKPCRNVYFYKRELEKKLEQLSCDTFVFIHGDCTFSNLMLRDNGNPVVIDPRGYFGCTELYGDERYDWAKLYYSIVGNYDRFNLKDFRLAIHDEEVELSVGSNKWEDMEADFFRLTGADPCEIKLLHAVIWLSLTTYAWQDYDSVCGAFYNGLWYLEDIL